MATSRPLEVFWKEPCVNIGVTPFTATPRPTWDVPDSPVSDWLRMSPKCHPAALEADCVDIGDVVTDYG